ncbi:MAG: Crp/Fnr family transcriptional regulator [Bacteroidota bacterium]
MKANTFRTFIENYVFLPEQDWTEIASHLDAQQIKKGDFILREGQICNHVYFLEEGLLRFAILKHGEYATKFFTVAPYAFTSQYSFANRLPSRESIEALEPSILWKISYEQSELLFKLESWNTFVRKLIQEVQFFTELILEEAQSETAEKRYIKLLEYRPELVQRVPLKHLASYLGVTPQSLSRIRTKIQKQP